MRRFVILIFILLVSLPVSAIASAGKGQGAQRSPAGHKNPLVTSRASVAPTTGIWIGLLETQAEDPKATPDWNITGSGLATVRAGSSIVFAQYFQIYKGPASINLTYIDNVDLNGVSVLSKTTTGALTNDPKSDWRHSYGPFTLKKPGTYIYWCTITYAGTSVSDRGTVVVQ